jgi:hypothetical protein
VRSSTPSRRRRATTWAQLIVAAGVLATALVQGTANAQEEPPDIEPILECVSETQDGELVARFGWNNRAGRILKPVLGIENQILPPKYMDLLKTEFAAGQVGTRNGGFTITFAEDETIVWQIFGRTAAASGASPRCQREGGSPATTVPQRPATTVAAAGPPPSTGRGSGRKESGGKGAPVEAAPAAAAPSPELEAAPLGLRDVVPAVLLGLAVLGAVAFGLDSAGRRTRS